MLRLPWVVTVGERVQKRHDILDVGFAQCGLIADASIKGSQGFDIGSILRGQIVEFQGGAVGPARVPLLRVSVPLGGKAHHILPAMKQTVMEERAASRHIAQGGSTEQTAVFPSIRQVGAQRPAQSEVVVTTVRIGGKSQIARRTDGGGTEIRELRKGTLPHA